MAIGTPLSPHAARAMLPPGSGELGTERGRAAEAGRLACTVTDEPGGCGQGASGGGP